MSGNFVVSACITALASIVRWAASLVQGAAFWTAVLLPLLYVPLLAVGYAAADDPAVVGQLVAVNVAALVVGAGYDGAVDDASDEPDAERSRP